MSSVRAIRGATQAAANTVEAIGDATKELLLEMLSANQLSPSEVISVIFTVSPDLNAAFPAGSARELGFSDVPLICSVEIDVPGALENAAFPAGSARELGFSDVPLICSVEIDVPGALERTIRVMAHVETSLSKGEISHIYLGAAKSLRRDIAQ